MSKTNDIFGIVFGVAGLIGIRYALSAKSQLAKVSERLDKGIDEIANDMEFDIPEELINKAVDKAVQTETRRAVESAAKEIVTKIEKDIHRDVINAVNMEYEIIKDRVLKEATESAAKIDANRVRRDVEEAAKKIALKKFDDNLDDILETFNDNLSNTAKIYSSIREALEKKQDSGKEFVVRLN